MKAFRVIAPHWPISLAFGWLMIGVVVVRGGSAARLVSEVGQLTTGGLPLDPQEEVVTQWFAARPMDVGGGGRWHQCRHAVAPVSAVSTWWQ